MLTMLLHALLVGSIVLCARPCEVMLQECVVQRLFIGASEELARCITVRVKICLLLFTSQALKDSNLLASNIFPDEEQ